MDTQQNVVIYPLVVMTFIFVISLFGLEYQFKKAWENQIDQELNIAAESTLTSISYLNHQLQFHNEPNVLHTLSFQQAANSKRRVTIINDENEVVGDSITSLAQLNDLNNSRDRREITIAKLTGYAKLTRFSELSNQQMVFVARYDANTGYTVRVGIAESEYDAAISMMRSGFLSVAIIAMIIMAIFGVFISQWIRKLIAKEKSLQDIRVADRTREISLMQTMSTMLNAAKDFNEVGQILLSIMPRLLPDISGKLYLLNERERLTELVSWGTSFNNNVSILVGQDGSSPLGLEDNKELVEGDVTRCHMSSHLICVDLIDAQELFGVIHFLGSKDTVRDKQVRNIVMKLSEQVSLGMTNLRVKNQLHNQAIRDPLTGLYNRRFMMEGFEQALNRAERHAANLAVLMIDLDYFKSFNDTFGHKTGDYVLTQVAELFKVNLRLEDIACRFGGEEFCMICPDTGLKEGYALAEKLRVAVEELELSDQQQLLGQISISIGLAIYPNHASTTQQLINLADSALYRAKSSGRNATVVFQDEQRGIVL